MGIPRLRVAVVLVRGEDILLVQHRKAGRTYWLVPGGGVEEGESLAAAACREVQEELGLQVAVDRLILLCEAIDPRGTRHIVNFFFLGHIEGGTLRRTPDDPVLVDARYWPARALATLETYPPVGPQLLAAFEHGFQGPVQVLGNTWHDPSPSLPD